MFYGDFLLPLFNFDLGCLSTVSIAAWHFVTWIEMNDFTQMSVVFDNVGHYIVIMCLHVVILVFFKCHCSVSADFITLVLGPFRAYLKVYLHLLKILWWSL